MRKVLVLVNYMRTNPTIVDDIINNFSKDFEKIYLINRNTKDDYKNIKCLKNVSILEISPYSRPFYYIKGFFAFFRKECCNDIRYAIQEHRFNFAFLKRYYKYVTIAEMLYGKLKNVKPIKVSPEQVSIMSIWFTYEAYAIARMKKKYPELNCISMAHAHEIETFDNKYTFILKKYQHANLDKIAFISKTKMNTYFNHVCNPLSIDTSTCSVLYWGSRYIDFIANNEHNDKKFIIVTCSTVEKLKRVIEIARAISILPDYVEWYHFGDGAIMQELLNEVDSYDSSVKSRMHIKGRVDNKLVREFYATNQVDLFINFSTTEGLPISVMEAMSYGIPCIVTDVGGEREIVLDGQNGFVIPRDISPKDLSTYILKFINIPGEIKKQYSSNAKKHWMDTFNLDENIKKYLEVLK